MRKATRDITRWILAAMICAMGCGTALCQEEAAEEQVDVVFSNPLPYVVDLFVMDENAEPPQEIYKATLPTAKVTTRNGKQTGFQVSSVTLKTWPENRWRVKLHTTKAARREDKPKRAADGTTVSLYDYLATAVPGQKHTINATEYFLRRLEPDMEVVLVGESGILLADDHPVESFGPVVNSTGARLRQRNASLLDPESEYNYYTWIVKPGNNERPGTFSFMLRLEEGDDAEIYLVARPEDQTGFVCAEAPVAEDRDDEEFQKQLKEFQESTSFTLRPDAGSTPLGLPLLLDRSDDRSVESYTETVTTEAGTTEITYDAKTRVKTSIFKGKNGSFKREQVTLPLFYKSNRFVVIPWGKSAAAGSLATLSLLDVKLESGEAWREADSPRFKPVESAVVDATANEIPNVRAQISSAIPFCRAGYHQLRLNPFDLAENGLGGQNNPIFATRSDLKKGNFYVSGDYRVPIDFFIQPTNKSQGSEQTRMYSAEQELTDTVASTLGVEAAGTTTATGGVGFGPVTASVAVQTNFSFGYGSSFGKTLSSQSGEQKSTIVKSKWASEFYLVLNRKNAELDEAFRTQLLALAEATTSEPFDKFFDTYGTHYPIASLMGGRASLQGTIASASQSSFVKEDGGYNWSAGTGAIVKGTKETSNSKKTSRTDEVQDWKSASVGGDGTSYDTWNKGDVKNLVPIKVYLRPIWQLVVPDLLFPQPVTQADHLLGTQLQVVVMKEWLRHLDPAQRGPRKRQSTDVDGEAFGIVLDDFKFETTRGKEMPTSQVPKLWGEVLRLKDLTPLKAGRMTKIPSDYILETINLPGQECWFNLHPDHQDKNKPLKPFRTMVTIPRGESEARQMESFAVRLFADFRGGSVEGGFYDAQANFIELKTHKENEAISGRSFTFLRNFGSLHQNPVDQFSQSKLYPSTLAPRTYSEDVKDFVFISSPVGVLLQGAKAQTEHWPGIDAATISANFNMQSQTMPTYNQEIGPKPSVRLIPVTLNFTLQVGQLTNVSEQAPNPPIDAGMPVVLALERKTP